jgi:hypothetical protein
VALLVWGGGVTGGEGVEEAGWREWSMLSSVVAVTEN